MHVGAAPRVGTIGAAEGARDRLAVHQLARARSEQDQDLELAAGQRHRRIADARGGTARVEPQRAEAHLRGSCGATRMGDVDQPAQLGREHAGRGRLDDELARARLERAQLLVLVGAGLDQQDRPAVVAAQAGKHLLDPALEPLRVQDDGVEAPLRHHPERRGERLDVVGLEAGGADLVPQRIGEDAVRRDDQEQWQHRFTTASRPPSCMNAERNITATVRHRKV